MNNIIYSSNINNKKYPENRNVNFICVLDDTQLSNIPDIPISIGIKSIQIKLNNPQPSILSINSNLSLDPSINSSSYSQVFDTFSTLNNTINNITSVEFKNPIFFKTNKDKLKLASFEIRNFNNNQPLESISIYDFPTKINCIIKPQSMYEPFNIILQSNDEKSKINNKENNETNFIVNLPKRFEFLKNDFVLCLRSLSLTNKLFNVKNKDYYVKLQYYEYKGFTPGKQEVKIQNKKWKNETLRSFYMKSGYYDTLEKFSDEINRIFTENAFPVSLILKEDNTFSFKWERDENYSKRNYSKLILVLSPGLSKALGYSQTVDETKLFNFNQRKVKNKDIQLTEYSSSHTPDIFLKSPKDICVNCNLVTRTSVGNTSMKLLNYIPIGDQINNSIMSFTMNSNDYVKLQNKSFESIEIKLTNLKGEDLGCDQKNVIPTTINLMFVDI